MILDNNPDLQSRLEKLDAQEINYRYLVEERMMTAIIKGDFEEYLEVDRMSDAPKDFSPRVNRLRNDPLRDRKNGLTTRKTLMRVAAKIGGVPPVYLHLLAERYGLLIEQASSTEYLDNVLAQEMAKAFCDAVVKVSVRNYSDTIKKTIDYIDSHLTEKLTVQSVAEIVHVHPTYLSRKFKEDTEWNFIDYVNNQRVNFAILQFYRGNEDITNVAISCGFSSSSYFTRVFKKYTGKPPSVFIQDITKSTT